MADQRLDGLPQQYSNLATQVAQSMQMGRRHAEHKKRLPLWKIYIKNCLCVLCLVCGVEGQLWKHRRTNAQENLLPSLVEAPPLTTSGTTFKMMPA